MTNIDEKIRQLVVDLNYMLETDQEQRGQNDIYKNAFEELAYMIESNLELIQQQYDDIKQAGLSISMADAEGALRNAMYISSLVKSVKENYLENEQDDQT